MKKIASIVVLLTFFSCTEQVNEVQLTDLKDHNMKIIPEKPNNQSEIKLVVFDDCTYNILNGVSRKDQTIDIKKQFNGMMKWPCFMKNDTILIGKLPTGDYNVNYTLIDISQAAPQNIAVFLTFRLSVSK